MPKDSQGARCGLDSHVKDKQYLFFFDLTKCFGPDVLFTGCNTPQVCTQLFFFLFLQYTVTNVAFSGVRRKMSNNVFYSRY